MVADVVDDLRGVVTPEQGLSVVAPGHPTARI
jgi:hypothetical protein